MIQFLTDPQNLLTLGVAVAAFATVFTLLSSMGGGSGLDKRMKAVAARREELKRRSRQAFASRTRASRSASSTS